jgi:hypothetical protein
MGNFNAANNINYSGKSTFASKAVAPYTVSGTSYGEFKNVGNLSWLRVFAAGHEVYVSCSYPSSISLEITIDSNSTVGLFINHRLPFRLSGRLYRRSLSHQLRPEHLRNGEGNRRRRWKIYNSCNE